MIAVDPFRPGDVMTIPAAVPPSCPNLHQVKDAPGQLLKSFLTPMSMNAAGDQRFDCLACGYQTIWRHAEQKYEKPGWWSQFWTPPVDQQGNPLGVPTARPVGELSTQPVTQPVASGDHIGATEAPTTKKPMIEDSPIHVEEGGVDKVDDQGYLSIKDAAEILGIKPTALLAKVRAGEIKSVVQDGVKLIPASEVGG